jgi:hypothetical protein
MGAILLEMTGMEKSRARFQALSAFSTTGFTTREAELVVNHLRRRKIVTYLMILGNAGIVSVIATFVLSLGQSGVGRLSLNLAVIAVSIFILYRVVSHRGFAQKLTVKLNEFVRKRFHFGEVCFEEIFSQTDGYGAGRLLVAEDDALVGKRLRDSGLWDREMLVLSIERDEEIIPLPNADSVIQGRDRLIVYGKFEEMHGLASVEMEASDTGIGDRIGG